MADSAPKISHCSKDPGSRYEIFFIVPYLRNVRVLRPPRGISHEVSGAYLGVVHTENRYSATASGTKLRQISLVHKFIGAKCVKLTKIIIRHKISAYENVDIRLLHSDYYLVQTHRFLIEGYWRAFLRQQHSLSSSIRVLPRILSLRLIDASLRYTKKKEADTALTYRLRFFFPPQAASRAIIRESSARLSDFRAAKPRGDQRLLPRSDTWDRAASVLSGGRNDDNYDRSDRASHYLSHTMQFSRKVTTRHRGSYCNLCEALCRNPLQYAPRLPPLARLALYHNPN